jgi:NDP-sugar pyrophosphorylase family protein
MTITVLITTSGTGDRLGDITKYTNKSLVKVGDKYAICYIIDAYDDDTEYIITLGYYGNYVKQFLLLAYPTKNFVFVEIDKYMGEGSSLGYSMLKAKEHLQKPFIFHCCDSIITNQINISYDDNILYVYPNETSDQYTNIQGVNNIVTKINEKGYADYDYIYTGIAYIKDYEKFWINLDDCYNNDKNNNKLNDVNSINLMITQNIVFKYVVINDWYDTGNVKSYQRIKGKNLSIDEVLFTKKDKDAIVQYKILKELIIFI